MKFHKTRLAPTPSGFLHLGNLYSFLLTAKLAEKYGAEIFLRIDDLDRERMQREYLEDVFETLNFAGIKWQEGPRNVEDFEKNYSQLKRLSLYNNALKKLKQGRKLFACSCSRAQILSQNSEGIYTGTCGNKNISFDEKDVCWRLKTDPGRKIKMKTLNDGIIETILPAEMRDFVVRKKDGFPAYQLASVIDDVHFGIDLVVRGQDLWNSSLAQLYLAEELGLHSFTETVFHHHALLGDKNGNKLSKSAGDTSIQYLRKSGKSKEEIFAELPGIL